MNDQEQLAEDLNNLIAQLEGLSIGDSDQSDLVFQACKKLYQAQLLAFQRSKEEE